MADDMGYECLGAYGSKSYQTPRIDRMAEEGILVSHCISNPLCTPSRVKIMTGRHNYRNYEYFGYLNSDEYTFGNLMNEAGYSTCIVGKWQLNGIYHNLPGNQDLSKPFGFGFDEYCLWQVHKGKQKGERYADPLIVQNGSELPRNPDDYGPDIFADYACDFIDRNRDHAFFLYYPMVLVHDPFVPTPGSVEWYDRDRRYENDTAYFKDMVEYTDGIVGRILDQLSESGIEENTLVIFTGDNGTNRAITSKMTDKTVTGGKGMTIDNGVHVPLVIRWPRMIRDAEIHHEVIEFSDFFATFAEIAGRGVENDGKSFLGMLKGKNYVERKLAFVHYDPMWGEWVNNHRNRFVQNTEYKLYQDGTMYDIVRDPLEENPLTGSWQKESSDTLSDEIKYLITRMQDMLNKAPRWEDRP